MGHIGIAIGIHSFIPGQLNPDLEARSFRRAPVAEALEALRFQQDEVELPLK